MNGLARTRALVAALGALVLLTVGACSSTADDQASSSATSSAAQMISNSAGSESTDPATPVDPDAGSVGATDGASLPAVTTSDIPAPATTAVVPPGGEGNITETVPAQTRSTEPAVPLTETAAAGDVAVSLTSLEKITTQAELPGEISGPGLEVTVSITNGSDTALDLINVVVDLQDAAGTPALPMIAAPASPFAGNLDPGATAAGVYVFTLPAGYTGPATVAVSYAGDAPVVVFTGDTP